MPVTVTPPPGTAVVQQLQQVRRSGFAPLTVTGGLWESRRLARAGRRGGRGY
jgi:hypothetical protein